MRIAQINTADRYGGAEKVALELHRAYLAAGHDSVLIVGHKRTGEPGVVWTSPRRRGKPLLMLKAVIEELTQIQYMSYPGRESIVKAMPYLPDVIHLHNLHGRYFDLAGLPGLTRIAPSVLTLHDMWTFTGHCAHSLECTRWLEGCGECPHLDAYPPLACDTSGANWRRKRRIFGKIKRLWVTAPSQWLLDLAARSPILCRFPRRLIPNGLDTATFSPGPSADARQALGLPDDGVILLFLAPDGPRSPYRDFDTLLEALGRIVRGFDGKLYLVSLGSESTGREVEATLRNRVIIRGYEPDERRIALYYRAADVLAYATRADNCPLTVLEAMACGLPVVGSAVGGVPELVAHGETGLLVPVGDAEAFAAGVLRVLRDDAMRLRLAGASRARAESRFSLDGQVSAFLELYREMTEGEA